MVFAMPTSLSELSRHSILRGYGKAVLLDLRHRAAEFRREMRPHRDEFQIQLGVRGQLTQRPVEVAIVRAGAGYYGDLSFHAFTRMRLYRYMRLQPRSWQNAAEKPRVPDSCLLLKDRA